MSDVTTCCAEYEKAATLSRRRFLGGMAAAGAAAVTTSVFGDAVRQTAFGATTGGNVLVVISCRGGLDGLGMVVPHGDPAYYTARPKLAVPKESLLARDAFFGLHPNLEPLQWLWDAGEVAAVHAVGLEAPNRSHFAAMEEIEDAAPGSSLRQGWVNRMLGLDSSPSIVGAVHLGDATPPVMIEGPVPSVAARDLEGVMLRGTDNGWAARRRQQLQKTWQGSGPLHAAAHRALDTVDLLGPVSARSYTPATAYPTSYPAASLAEALRDTARLLKADIGAEVVSVDFGSWDMHTSYGSLASGEMQRMVDGFAQSVDAFLRDLGPLRSRVTLVTISEFGRRVNENGSRGLDHGWGNMMLVMGAGVKGGYYAQWPGLADGTLVNGDLAVTTDYRQVLGEVVHKRFPGKDVSAVFPGVPFRPLGLMR